MTRNLRLGGVASHVMLALVTLAVLFPFLWMLDVALKPNAAVFQVPPRIISDGLHWDNFAGAWDYLPFGSFMVNGALVAGIGSIVVLATSCCAGYAFARIPFPGREKVFVAYLGTLMVPQEVVVVPMFLLMKYLGWVNSYQALILPWAFTAFGTFLMRQFFMTVPTELEDAARIDGASRLRTLWSVMLPLARPALGVLAVFTFINYWNSFLWPLIVVNTQDYATVPLGLNMFHGQYGSQWNFMMAASAISMAPSALLVIVLQRYLVRGIAMTGFGGR